jgi:wyosine [tRNA(Phe)-imidazoG37] synthetase (radical SAM superfamily)
MSGRSNHRVFGPVLSRRLGRSLGVDLVPFKTCTYDCIYCQLGRTTAKTLAREEYVPVAEVFAELDRACSREQFDYVTLSGSGEPTLHARLEDVVAGIKDRTSVPVAVLTNGSLLWDPQVRHDLRKADVVIPSLDAGSEALFRHVNRPHGELSLNRVVDGLLAFRDEFAGAIWLEVFLLGGVTGIEAEVRQIAELAGRLGPDRIHLNTVSRPPAEDYAMPVPPERMQELAALFGGRAEVVSERPAGQTPDTQADHGDADVSAILRRRPCTMEDLSTALAVPPAQVAKCLDHLASQGVAVATKWVGSRRFFSITEPKEDR